jgi:signal transduction histidine kinase
MIFFLLFALILVFGARAQDTTLQRIRALPDDSTKVVSLAKYAYTLIGTDNKKAIQVYEEVKSLSTKLSYPYWQGMALLNTGLAKAQDANDREAISFFEKAVPYFKKAGRIDKVAASLMNIGSCSERVGDVSRKINNLFEAIRLLEATEHKDLLAHAYNALGIVFYNQDNFPKGFTYFDKALGVARAIKDTAESVQSLYGMSNCRAAMKQFPEALAYSNEALALARQGKDEYLLMLAYTSLSELYNKWGKGREAIQHASAILQHAAALGHVHYQLISYMNMAEGYGLAGQPAQQVAWLNEALKIGTANGIVLQLDDIYKGLSEGYAKLQQPAAAFDYYKKYIVYRDSATNEKNKKHVAELEIRYRAAEREKALAAKQLQVVQKDLQLQRSRQYTLYSIAATIVALLMAALIYLEFRNKRKIQERQLNAMKQQQEIKLLQALMQGEEKERGRIAKDLHDGVAGMLAAAKMHLSTAGQQHEAVLACDGFKQGLHLLSEASYEVRKTSHNLMPEVLSTHGLDIALRRYCQSISNGSALVVQYDSWGDIKRLPKSLELSVYRVVQELLNNIIKHSGASTALVQLSQNEAVLSITVEDNGVGFDRAATGHEGMGLSSLKERVESMNGIFEVDTQPGEGVSVYLEFDTVNLTKEATVAV